MTQEIKIGSKLDFTKGAWRKVGVAVVSSIKYGRVQNTYTLKCVDGTKEGSVFNAPVRHGRSLLDYCTIVGEDLATAKAQQEAQFAKQEARWEAAREAERFIEPGDIVRITTEDSSWSLKVLEIDNKMGRVKGVSTTATASRVSGKMAYASLVNRDVEITITAKRAFDPETDAVVLAMKERARRTGVKRAATRERKADLRNYFGGY